MTVANRFNSHTLYPDTRLLDTYSNTPASPEISHTIKSAFVLIKILHISYSTLRRMKFWIFSKIQYRIFLRLLQVITPQNYASTLDKVITSRI